jgi:hypothetical protein
MTLLEIFFGASDDGSVESVEILDGAGRSPRPVESSSGSLISCWHLHLLVLSFQTFLIGVVAPTSFGGNSFAQVVHKDFQDDLEKRYGFDRFFFPSHLGSLAFIGSTKNVTPKKTVFLSPQATFSSFA